MNFRRTLSRDEPEINFIPLIDLLLVILIFLMVTTTYNRYSELQVKLPAATGDAIPDRPREVVVSVSADGVYTINRQPAAARDPATLATALRDASRSVAGDSQAEPTIVINADAGATHQSVVNVLEAARLAGLARVTFAAQSNATN